MKNAEVARIFESIAELLELKGDENPFRIRAYQRAAQNIGGFTKDISDIPADELTRLPGIGKDLAGKIREIVETGTCGEYESLKKAVPDELRLVLTVPGVGPKTAKLFYEKLKVRNIDQLERLARKHKLSVLPGIKARTEENILRGIEMLKRSVGRTPLGITLPLALDIIVRLKKDAPIGEIAYAGSLRRFKETVGDIDILCTSAKPEKVMNVFCSLDNVRDVLAHGPTKSSVVLEEKIQVDLRVVEKASFGAAMAYFTGSKAHNIRLREMALRDGLKLNEYGVFREKDNKRLGGRKEADVYKALGLPFIPPELREDAGEIEAAQAGSLPALIEPGDIKGDLHVHTSHSDGAHDIAELAVAARKRGYSYIAITDHSKSLGVAGGLDKDELMDEIREIDAINMKLHGFRVIKGVEVDIRSDGSLDFDDSLLSKLDVVVASVHSGFRQSEQKLTARIKAAMENPYVTIIAHPTGRLIGRREAYDVDMDEVLRTAARTGTAMEINAYPLRLDLNARHSRAARDLGVPLSVSTDAHAAEQFDFMPYGVGTARRAWLEKEAVLNALPLRSLTAKLRKMRIRNS